MRTRKKMALTTVVTGAALLVPALPSASAASTGEIIQDAQDGQIDGLYSQGSLDAALASPLLKTYGGVAGVQAVKSALGANTVTTSGSGQLPFTGAEMLTFAVLGSTLLAAGFITRRQARPDRPDDTA
jgi:hypothetical protein